MASVLSCSYRLLTKACTAQRENEQALSSNIITLEDNLKLSVTTSIDNCKDWNIITEKQSLFVQKSYLKAIEN